MCMCELPHTHTHGGQKQYLSHVEEHWSHTSLPSQTVSHSETHSSHCTAAGESWFMDHFTGVYGAAGHVSVCHRLTYYTCKSHYRLQVNSHCPLNTFASTQIKTILLCCARLASRFSLRWHWLLVKCGKLSFYRPPSLWGRKYCNLQQQTLNMNTPNWKWIWIYQLNGALYIHLL